MCLAALIGKLIDQPGQCRQRRPDGGAVRRGQLVERIADALLVGAGLVGELAGLTLAAAVITALPDRQPPPEEGTVVTVPGSRR